jgi:serine/threonine protein kinase
METKCLACNTENPAHVVACYTCGAWLDGRAALVVPESLPRNATLLNHAYEVLQVLGRGGFAITYLCQDKHLDRLVALKEFFPAGSSRRGAAVRFSDTMTAAGQQEAKLKFLTEARVLSRLQHPNVVRVHSLFEEHNTAYMVMEFLNGRSLEQILAERGPLPEPEAVAYTEKIGEALAAVHEAHFIHRDVKPENIMLCGEERNDSNKTALGERLVLLDFGLNHELERAAGYGTIRLNDHIRFGTPGYAPPEQYGRHFEHGPYTDLYALGATLFRLLTGEIPVDAPERTYGVDQPTVRSLAPHVTRRTEEAVAWALQLDHEKRPQQAREFLEALRSEKRAFALPALGALGRGAGVAKPPPKTDEPDHDPDRAAILGIRRKRAAQVAPHSPGGRRAATASTAAGVLPGAERALNRTGRHLTAGLRDILPNALVVGALIAAAIVVGRNQQGAQASRRNVAVKTASIQKRSYTARPGRILRAGMSDR